MLKESFEVGLKLATVTAAFLLVLFLVAAVGNTLSEFVSFYSPVVGAIMLIGTVFASLVTGLTGIVYVFKKFRP